MTMFPYRRPMGSFPMGDASSTLAAATSFASCAADAIDPTKSWGDVARCVWGKLKPIIEARSDVEAMFETVTNSDCGTVLGSLGVPSVAASVITVFAGSFWTRVQNLAADELYAIYRRRGRERSTAEGGGHTLVDGRGVTVAIECPGVLDGDGRPTLFEPGASCPVPGAGPRYVALRPGGTVSRLPIKRKKEPVMPKAQAKGIPTVAVVGGVGLVGVLLYLALA